MPPGSSERVAEAALAEALRRLCRGGSWEGLARELAWRAVTEGGCDPRRVDRLSEAAASMLAGLIDDALWAVERSALEAWDEFLEARPDDRAGALTAASLDAGEEAERLATAAYERVREMLLEPLNRAA